EGLARGGVHPLRVAEPAAEHPPQTRHAVAGELLPHGLRRRQAVELGLVARRPEVPRVPEVRHPGVRVIAPEPPAAHPTGPALARGLGLWEATAINITQIVGAGVFVTIPLILGVLPGASALLAWLVAGVLILADSMIWGELGAALPAAGGSYPFLLECYGRWRWGRVVGFLFGLWVIVYGRVR